MANIILLSTSVLAAFFVASNSALVFREKRQAGFGSECQADGPIPYSDDCSKFLQCHQGVARLMSCPAGLEFNPQNNWCDFPNNVQGGNCQRVAPSSQANAPCLARTGNGQAYFVAHPSYCNAFFNCGNGLLYPGCTFCPQGQYFSEQVGQCVTSYDTNVEAVCQGKQMVPPVQQEISRLEASCRPGRPDDFAALLQKIRGGGGFQNGQQGGFGQQQQGNTGFGGQQQQQQQTGGFNQQVSSQSQQSFQTSSTNNQQQQAQPQTFSRGQGYFYNNNNNNNRQG